MNVTRQDAHAISGWVLNNYEWMPSIIFHNGVAYCQCPMDLGVIRVTRNDEGALQRCCQFCDKAGMHVPYEIARDTTVRCSDHPWSPLDEHARHMHLMRPQAGCAACLIEPGDMVYAMINWRVWIAVEYIGPLSREAEERIKPMMMDPRIVRDVWTGHEYIVAPGNMLPDEPMPDLDFTADVFGY